VIKTRPSLFPLRLVNGDTFIVPGACKLKIHHAYIYHTTGTDSTLYSDHVQIGGLTRPVPLLQVASAGASGLIAVLKDYKSLNAAVNVNASDTWFPERFTIGFSGGAGAFAELILEVKSIES